MSLKSFEKDKKEKSQYENREFISANQKYLKMLKSQYPEEFERFYWYILVCVKRNDIFQNTVYSKMLPFTALVVSCISIVKGDIASIFVYTVYAFAIVLFGLYIWLAMDTREPSYYEIMLSILEDLRNAQEETLLEGKYSRYIVTLQSCNSQEEDRPAKTYDVTIQQSSR